MFRKYSIGLGVFIGFFLFAAQAHAGATSTVPFCGGMPATIFVNASGTVVGGPDSGTFYSGVLWGTDGDDVIVGVDGTSTSHFIRAGAGNDIICGGSGNDIIKAGNGDDLVCAGAGNDEIRGGLGDDKVDAGEGTDTIDAKDGFDICAGGENTTGCSATLPHIPQCTLENDNALVITPVSSEAISTNNGAHFSVTVRADALGADLYVPFGAGQLDANRSSVILGSALGGGLFTLEDEDGNAVGTSTGFTTSSLSSTGSINDGAFELKDGEFEQFTVDVDFTTVVTGFIRAQLEALTVRLFGQSSADAEHVYVMPANDFETPFIYVTS